MIIENTFIEYIILVWMIPTILGLKCGQAQFNMLLLLSTKAASLYRRRRLHHIDKCRFIRGFQWCVVQMFGVVRNLFNYASFIQLQRIQICTGMPVFRSKHIEVVRQQSFHQTTVLTCVPENIQFPDDSAFIDGFTTFVWISKQTFSPLLKNCGGMTWPSLYTTPTALTLAEKFIFASSVRWVSQWSLLRLVFASKVTISSSHQKPKTTFRIACPQYWKIISGAS